MEAYITGLGLISPQDTFLNEGFLDATTVLESNHLRCIEPLYKNYLDPVLARRMGRIIKMGVAASAECLKDAGVSMPDAIISGTALGCLESTEKFLLSVIEDDEQFLTPTQFIQSTQNTVAAQIALQLQCTNYNFTYVHRAFSFESAVMDALISLQEGAGNVLVGGHDEMTVNNYSIYRRLGTWKSEIPKDKELLQSKSQGTIAGEGAGFFMLSAQPVKQAYAKLKSLKTLYTPADQEEINSSLQAFLKQNGLQAAEIDLVIYGTNGDIRYDSCYENVKNSLFPSATAAYFKHLCGEYQTSGAFALWLAARILKEGKIPDAVLLEKPIHKQLKYVLIYNHFMNDNHVFYLLENLVN